MSKDIEDMVGGLSSKADFIHFLDTLNQDAVDNLGKWENQTVPDFLEAMSAWAEDCDGYYDNFGIKIDTDVPSWRLFADILLAARVYE